MTVEELDEKYSEASWLIAKRSASAAGKALMFGSESLEDTVRDISSIYQLSDGEVASLQPRVGSGAVANAQKLAQGLLSDGAPASTGQAVMVARTAIQNGHVVKMLAGLIKAGPKAAQAAATGGAVASKGTPWGWIATAGYAAGSAGWYAYNARAFNLQAYELVRGREGIELIRVPAEVVGQAAAAETITLEVKVPSAAAIAARASRLTDTIGSTVTGVFGRFRKSQS